MKVFSFVRPLGRLVQSLILTGALVVVPTVAASAQATTSRTLIKYDGHTGSNKPEFNVFTDVPNSNGVGTFNEQDFFTARESTTDSSVKFVDPLAVHDGELVQLRVYMHNGAYPQLNADGSGIANDAKVRIVLPEGSGTSLSATAYITSSNTVTKEISDTVTLNDSKDFKIELVKGAGQYFSAGTGMQSISDNVTKDGISVGSKAMDGKFYACWDERGWLVITVKVIETPKPPVVKTPATCDLLDVTAVDRKVTVNKIKYTANDATVSGVNLSFGDGKQSQELSLKDIPYDYTFDKDGSYTITAILRTSLGDVKDNKNCVASVNISTTPTEIPKTGAGSLVGLFAAVSMAGAIAHRVYIARKFSN
jgi:hypothetical protein